VGIILEWNESIYFSEWPLGYAKVRFYSHYHSACILLCKLVHVGYSSGHVSCCSGHMQMIDPSRSCAFPLCTYMMISQ